MGKQGVPIRETSEYRELQKDQMFQSWLRMQDAAMELEFIIYDAPELRGNLYTREGLVIAERKALELFESERSAFTDETVTLGMRFVYFIGETIRRATEGTWVALPPNPPRRTGPTSAIDVGFSPAFYDPQDMLGIVLVRRTGTVLSRIFDFAVEDYQQWVGAGRPPRIG